MSHPLSLRYRFEQAGAAERRLARAHVWRPPILPKADRQCGKCGCAESSIASKGPCRGSFPSTFTDKP